MNSRTIVVSLDFTCETCAGESSSSFGPLVLSLRKPGTKGSRTSTTCRPRRSTSFADSRSGIGNLAYQTLPLYSRASIGGIKATSPLFVSPTVRAWAALDFGLPFGRLLERPPIPNPCSQQDHVLSNLHDRKTNSLRILTPGPRGVTCSAPGFG